MGEDNSRVFSRKCSDQSKSDMGLPKGNIRSLQEVGFVTCQWQYPMVLSTLRQGRDLD